MSTHCDICSLDFMDEYSFQGHLLGKKHIGKVESKKVNMRKQQNSIYVSPLPLSITPRAVFEFFSKFGSIEYYNFQAHYVIIEFQDKSSAEHLLNNPIYLDDFELQIARTKINTRLPETMTRLPKKSQSQKTEEDAITEALRVTLVSEDDLGTQVTKFLDSIQRNKEEVCSKASSVCSSLEKTMRLSFPKCRAIPFGSSVTGLSLLGSDLDVFLDIGVPIGDDEKVTEPCAVWTPRSIFKKVKNLLFRKSSVFTKIVPIPAAKIPVIKFLHIPTGMDCDISFKHGLGVYNSELISHLLNLDFRIKPLILILKYWAKNLNISGSGKINNYSLVMLIVFYLQQPTINLLPTINDLQNINEKIYIRGWQVNFNKDYPSISNNNFSSILELLEGFFKLYADFDFSKTIICPAEGKSYCRKKFKKDRVRTGGDIESLKLTRNACLQDPIQLDHNIISGWGDKEVLGLRLSCLQGLEICNASRESPISILPKLLDPALRRKTNRLKPVSFTIPAGNFERFGLPVDFDEKVLENKQEYIERNWFCSVYTVMELILQRIFCLEVQVVFDEVGVKQIKTDKEEDVHSQARDRILLSCSGKYLLHMGRKGKGQCVDPSVSPIEREGMISQKIMKEKIARVDEKPIKFELLMVKKTKPLQVVIKLNDRQFTNESFTHIARWIQSNMKNYVEKEFMHMIQYKKTLRMKEDKA